MAYQRKMHDVSHMGLRCADCGDAIDTLPFEPSDDRPVYCRDCAQKRRKDKPQGPRRPPR